MNSDIRLPAEWEKHQSTILCWPHQREDWPGRFTPIPWVYAEIVKILCREEKIYILVKSLQHQQKVQGILNRSHISLHNIHFIIAETDRSWMRDTSPVFIKENNKKKAVRFLFNGWAKYPNHKKDQQIPDILSTFLRTPLENVQYKSKDVVLEGGAIDTNGQGSLLTTEECLLDAEMQVRNPGFTKKEYENIFRDFLGITNVIWLGKGIAGDDTHGHVDDLCRFVSADTVVAGFEKNKNDENYIALNENQERLQDAKTEDGRNLDIVKLPMPQPLFYYNFRLPASFVNFYISNNSVLVPTFNDPNDRVALNILNELFPDKEIIGIHAVDLIWGLGAIHCLTHEVPQ